MDVEALKERVVKAYDKLIDLIDKASYETLAKFIKGEVSLFYKGDFRGDIVRDYTSMLEDELTADEIDVDYINQEVKIIENYCYELKQYIDNENEDEYSINGFKNEDDYIKYKFG